MTLRALFDAHAFPPGFVANVIMYFGLRRENRLRDEGKRDETIGEESPEKAAQGGNQNGRFDTVAEARVRSTDSLEHVRLVLTVFCSDKLCLYSSVSLWKIIGPTIDGNRRPKETSGAVTVTSSEGPDPWIILIRVDFSIRVF
jgi:hypothetical protein